MEPLVPISTLARRVLIFEIGPFKKIKGRQHRPNSTGRASLALSRRRGQRVRRTHARHEVVAAGTAASFAS